MRLLPPSRNTPVHQISTPTCSSAGGKKTTGSIVSPHEITSECNKQVQPVRILRSFFFFFFLLIHPNERGGFFFFFPDWGLLSPLASGGKSRTLMASDMLWTWRNAQEGSIPHVPLPQSSDGGGSERARSAWRPASRHTRRSSSFVFYTAWMRI